MLRRLLYCFGKNKTIAVSQVEASGLALKEQILALPKGRAREMALIHLTECSMWTELAVREAAR